VIFATGAVEGTKITLFKPDTAESPDRELAAFPVEAQKMVSNPFSIAFATAMALALSLKDASGFVPVAFSRLLVIPYFLERVNDFCRAVVLQQAAPVNRFPFKRQKEVKGPDSPLLKRSQTELKFLSHKRKIVYDFEGPLTIIAIGAVVVYFVFCEFLTTSDALQKIFAQTSTPPMALTGQRDSLARNEYTQTDQLPLSHPTSVQSKGKRNTTAPIWGTFLVIDKRIAHLNGLFLYFSRVDRIYYTIEPSLLESQRKSVYYPFEEVFAFYQSSRKHLHRGCAAREKVNYIICALNAPDTYNRQRSALAYSPY
jgi:hypothetical protein